MVLPALIILIIFLVYVVLCPKKQRYVRRASCGNSRHMHPQLNREYMAAKPVYMEYMDDKKQMSHEDHQIQSMGSIDEPGSNDYQEFMVSSGIEASVIDSHKAFAKDITTTTSTASAESVFSHDDSIVPSWGLRRASAAIPISQHAREVPSLTIDQIKENSSQNRFGLF